MGNDIGWRVWVGRLAGLALVGWWDGVVHGSFFFSLSLNRAR